MGTEMVSGSRRRRPSATQLGLVILAPFVLQACGLMGGSVRTQELVARSASAPPRWIQGAPATAQSYYAVGRGEAWLDEGVEDESAAIEDAIDKACQDAAAQLVDTHLTRTIRDATAQVLLPGDNHPLRLREESQKKVTAFVVEQLAAARGEEGALVRPLFNYEERYRVREGGSVIPGLMIRRFVLFEVARERLEATIPQWVEGTTVVKTTRALQAQAGALEEQIVQEVERAIQAADEGRYDTLAQGVEDVRNLQRDLDQALMSYRELTGTVPPVDLEAGEEAARRLRLRAGKEGRNLRLSYGVFVTWSSDREREAFGVVRRTLDRLEVPSIPTTGKRCGVGVSHWLTLTVERPSCEAAGGAPQRCRLAPELIMGRCVHGGELDKRQLDGLEMPGAGEGGPDEATTASLWGRVVAPEGGALAPAVEQIVQQHFPTALIPGLNR